MYSTERRLKVLELIKEKKRITVKELSKIFKISGVTIRSDLNILSNQSKILRTHGGAIYIQESNIIEIPFERRKKYLKEIKESIAKAAASLINENDIVFIDGSTTAVSMIPFLKEIENITVITNSIEVAYQLAHLSIINIIVIGGILKKETFSLVRNPSDNTINEINIGKAFFGSAGLTIEEGLTDINTDEINLRKKIIEKSKKVIALVDSSKWGKLSLTTFLNTERIDTIISDSDAPKNMITKLEKIGVKTIIVPKK